jgi:hypothetical protein
VAYPFVGTLSEWHLDLALHNRVATVYTTLASRVVRKPSLDSSFSLSKLAHPVLLVFELSTFSLKLFAFILRS